MGMDKLSEIETRLDSLEKDLLMMRINVNNQTETVDQIDGKLDELLLEMSRYRGVFGGLMLAAACVWSFIKLVGLSWFQR